MSQEAYASETDAEDHVADLLENSHLPHEIQQRWEAANRELTPKVRLASLTKLIEGRKKVLSSPVSKSPDTPRRIEVTETSPLAIQKMIEAMHKGGHELVGVGKSAQVIASIRNPTICYKVFFEPNQQPIGVNDIAEEADIQKEIFEIGEHAGVRVPRVYFFIINKDFRAIAMERLPAVSLQDVLLGREVLPPSFNFDSFFKALSVYVETLHERNFYHRDLHDGNIMVDIETGKPYVIDFGFTVKSTTDEGIYRPEVVISGRKQDLVLLSDTVGIQSVRAAIARHLKNIGSYDAGK